jgi:predicted PurR-regulated permease PerM
MAEEQTAVSQETAVTPTLSPPTDSPTWSRSTKVIVTVSTLLLIALLAWRFQSLLQQLVIAAILAYLLNPIIIILDGRTRLKRTQAILLTYLALAILVIGGLVAIGIVLFEETVTFINQVPTLIGNITSTTQNSISALDPIRLGPYEVDPSILDWRMVEQQLLGLVEPTLSQGGSVVRDVAAATISLVGNIFFIFVISIYFAIEIPFLSQHVRNLATQPGYQNDAERIMREFSRVWNAYLRGQIILALVIFFVVSIGLSLLGVQNALALGLLAGLLEFIPVVGALIGTAVAVVVAFFQPTTIFALESWQYALVILGFMIIVQQLENNILVPRIVGDALDLNPIIVMIAVLMGASIAGILGAILAAPVMASLKLLGGYAWRKMFDLPPFPNPERKMAPLPTQQILNHGRSLFGKK